MSPMIWFIFPFIMVLLVLICVVTLDEELHENKGEEWNSVNEYKYFKW